MNLHHDQACVHVYHYNRTVQKSIAFTILPRCFSYLTESAPQPAKWTEIFCSGKITVEKSKRKMSISSGKKKSLLSPLRSAVLTQRW